jgi:hypothetical protein
VNYTHVIIGPGYVCLKHEAAPQVLVTPRGPVRLVGVEHEQP